MLVAVCSSAPSSSLKELLSIPEQCCCSLSCHIFQVPPKSTFSVRDTVNGCIFMKWKMALLQQRGHGLQCAMLMLHKEVGRGCSKFPPGPFVLLGVGGFMMHIRPHVYAVSLHETQQQLLFLSDHQTSIWEGKQVPQPACRRVLFKPPQPHV